MRVLRNPFACETIAVLLPGARRDLVGWELRGDGLPGRSACVAPRWPSWPIPLSSPSNPSRSELRCSALPDGECPPSTRGALVPYEPAAWFAQAVTAFGRSAWEQLSTGAGEPEKALRAPLVTLVREIGSRHGLRVVPVGEAMLSDLQVRSDYAVWSMVRSAVISKSRNRGSARTHRP